MLAFAHREDLQPESSMLPLLVAGIPFTQP